MLSSVGSSGCDSAFICCTAQSHWVSRVARNVTANERTKWTEEGFFGMARHILCDAPWQRDRKMRKTRMRNGKLCVNGPRKKNEKYLNFHEMKTKRKNKNRMIWMENIVFRSISSQIQHFSFSASLSFTLPIPLPFPPPLSLSLSLSHFFLFFNFFCFRSVLDKSMIFV